MRRHSQGAQVFEKARDLYSNSKDLAQDSASRAKTFIHESPVLSTLLGVGAGFLIGLWMKRSD